MIHRFDHAVIAVRDLDGASRAYSDALGFTVKPGGIHPGAGTYNSIIRLGLDYLELLAVRDREEAMPGWLRGTQLLSFLSGHEGLVGFVLASDDIDGDTARAAEAGVQTVGPLTGRRERPDGSVFSWRHSFLGWHPWRQPVPFLIQYDQPDAERLRQDPPLPNALGVTHVAAINIAVRDLDAAMRLYEDALGLHTTLVVDVPALGARRARIPLGNCRINLLAPVRDDGLIARTLADVGEGPFHVTLAAWSVDKAKEALTERGTGFKLSPGTTGGGVLIDPDRAQGARIVLIKEMS